MKPSDYGTARSMRKMLSRSKVVGIFGAPDSGKTFLAANLSWWMLEHVHGFVLSNIPLVRWTGEREVEASLDNYIVCDDFGYMFARISEILVNDRDARFLVVCDEAQRFSKTAWQSPIAQLLRATLPLVRKVNIVFVFLAVSEELLLKELREDESLVHIRIYKGGYYAETYARDALEQGYDPKQLAFVRWPLEGIEYEPLLVMPKPYLAVPVEEARKEPGLIYFDTKGISDWNPNPIHPATGKPFSMDAMLDAIKGIGWDVPLKLYNHMHGIGIEVPAIDRKEVLVELPEDRKEKPSTQKGIQPEVDRLIKAGISCRQVVAETGCSKRFYYLRKKELRKTGAIS